MGLSSTSRSGALSFRGTVVQGHWRSGGTVVVPGGRAVLVAERGLQFGGVMGKARLPVLAHLAVLEAVQAGLPAGRVARGDAGTELLGQHEDRAAVRRRGKLEADRVLAPGEADPVR